MAIESEGNRWEIMKWYFKVLTKYAVFAGRARRKEFWTFFLVNLLIIFSLRGIDILLGTWNRVSHSGLLSVIFEFAILIPTIAVSIRRLHDTNRTGWWILIHFIPLIGWIPFYIFMGENSQPSENRYGPDPKADVVVGPAP